MVNVDTITVVPMVDAHFSAVHQLLTTTFRRDEPMNRNVHLTVDECSLAFADLAHHCIDSGVSFVAIDPDTEQVVGIRLSSVKIRDQKHEDPENYYDVYPKKTATILSLLDNLSGCLLDKVPSAVKKIFKFEILCVQENYRRHGIAKKTVDVSMALCKQQDFDAVATTATSFKTQTLFEKMGFVTLNTIVFEDYRDKFGEPVFHDMPAENKIAKLMVKYLKPF